MFEIQMAPGGRAVPYLAPYALAVFTGLALAAFGATSWGSDERASAALLAGLAMSVGWGRPLLRRMKILRSKVVTLRWDVDGVEVGYGRLEDISYARLSWEDVAVVVACRLRAHRGVRPQYVAFVPVADDRVQGDTDSAAARGRARSLGVSPPHALMTWLEPFGQAPGVDEVLAEVGRVRPGLPVKDLR
jgi:hypothetical protein